MPDDFNEPITLFITWTTYGSWLPGDSRGWVKWKKGKQRPQPHLEDWCKGRMKEKAVLLSPEQREAVESVIRKHAEHRGWELHAVSARSNHVHVAVTVGAKNGNQEERVVDGVKRVRDQFKANATRVLRQGANPIQNEKVWTKGGDIQFVDTDDDLEQVVIYITEAQDRMGRGKFG
ncbi:MAG: transposase [Planctomycetota bacterium]